MARKDKKEEPKVTVEQLEALADEINAVLGLPDDEQIVFGDNSTEEEMIEAIKAVADGQIYESDFEVREGEGEEEGVTFFSEEADKTMELIGVEVLEGAPPEPEAEKEEEKPAPKGKAGKKEDEKPAAKGKEKEAPAKGKEKAAASAKKETAPAKKSNEPRYTRANAFADAVDALGADKKVIALDKLAEEANKQYMKKGNGKDNLKEAKWYQGTIVPCLIALDFAEVTDAGFKLK